MILRSRGVEVFVGGGAPLPVSMLDQVRDSATGKYLGPVDTASQEEAVEQFYEIPQSIIEAEQDRQLKERLSNIASVVVDTGMMHEHPLLAGRVIADVDFTGEGSEDRHGHGTVVALLISTVRFWPLINVKVVSGAGQGSPKALVRALDWIREYKMTHPETIVVANLSLGTYSRRFLFFRCRGGCSICRAARRLAQSDVSILAAAGNTPGRTACPATVAVFQRKAENVFAVDAPDLPTSGIGTLHGPGRVAPFIPVSPSSRTSTSRRV